MMVSWLGGPNLEPMEDHVAEYNAYLANEFGYGFEGSSFVHLPYEGPKSKAAVLRWLGFWKAHEAFFKQGYMLHLRAPNGSGVDAIIHVVEEGGKKRALLVAFNPTEHPLQDTLSLDVLRDSWLSAGGMDRRLGKGRTTKYFRWKNQCVGQSAGWHLV